MELNSYMRDGFAVIEIIGRLDAEHTAALKNEFNRLHSAGRIFVMEMSRVEFLDSTGLGGLVFCLKACNENGTELRLAAPGVKARMILQITRADRIFPIFDSLDAALAAP